MLVVCCLLFAVDCLFVVVAVVAVAVGVVVAVAVAVAVDVGVVVGCCLCSRPRYPKVRPRGT